MTRTVPSWTILLGLVMSCSGPTEMSQRPGASKPSEKGDARVQTDEAGGNGTAPDPINSPQTNPAKDTGGEGETDLEDGGAPKAKDGGDHGDGGDDDQDPQAVKELPRDSKSCLDNVFMLKQHAKVAGSCVEFADGFSTAVLDQAPATWRGAIRMREHQNDRQGQLTSGKAVPADAYLGCVSLTPSIVHSQAFWVDCSAKAIVSERVDFPTSLFTTSKLSSLQTLVYVMTGLKAVNGAAVETLEMSLHELSNGKDLFEQFCGPSVPTNAEACPSEYHQSL